MADKTFEVKGVHYPVHPLEDFDFDEIHEFQRISGINFGRAPLELAEENGDAWRAYFTVCVRRVNPELDETYFKGVKLTQLLARFATIEDEEGEERPDPQTAPPSENGGSGADESATAQTRGSFGTRPGITISG